MNCLTCQSRMATVTEGNIVDELSYEICEDCGGLWLDRGELDKLAWQTPGSVEVSTIDYQKQKENKEWDEFLKKHPLISYRKCQRCDDETMNKIPFMDNNKIVLDYCNKCGGFWLDGGELNQVNKYIRELDDKAKPSKFDFFLRHLHSTFWHRVTVTRDH